MTGFVQALVGSDRISGGTGLEGIGLSASNNSLGVAVGGGVDYWINGRMRVRLGQADYLFTRHLNNLDVPSQHNFRFSAGIVFSLGGPANAANLCIEYRIT
jgi:hypothetical protein